MDWTIPLHVQQLDFIERLHELRQSPNASLLLTHDRSGVWSERVKIHGDRLSQIRAQCRQRILKSDPTVPVGELWQQYLLDELATTAAGYIWPHQLQSVEETTNQFYWLEATSTPVSSPLRVQVIGVTGQTIDELPYPENPERSDLLLWVWVEESLEDAYQDYHPVILGFLPSDRLPRDRSLTPDQLWYGGGVRGYVQGTQSRRIAPSEDWLRPLMGSSNCAYPLAIAADGKTVASTGYDGSLKLWRLSEGQLQEALGGRTWSAAPSTPGSSGQTLSTRDADNIYHCCHSGHGKLLRSLPGLRSGVTAVLLDFPGERLICGGQGGKIEIWQVDSGAKQHSFAAHEGAVRFLAISASGTRFASAGTDRRIRVWHWENNVPNLLFSQVRDGISSLTLSPDGRQVGCGFQNGQIEVWQVTNGDHCQRLQGHSGPVRSLAISDDGTALASSSIERTLKLWETDTGHLKGLHTGHADPLISVFPNAEGCWIEVSLFQGDSPNRTSRG